MPDLLLLVCGVAGIRLGSDVLINGALLFLYVSRRGVRGPEALIVLLIDIRYAVLRLGVPGSQVRNSLCRPHGAQAGKEPGAGFPVGPVRWLVGPASRGTDPLRKRRNRIRCRSNPRGNLSDLRCINVPVRTGP